MSHKATSWLAGLRGLKPGEFVVLFHLCDCHNPSQGCFPSQKYLMDRASISNGSLNNQLNALEKKGLIQRVKSVDPTTKRQRPTHYILGFDIDETQEPTPKVGDGADSKKQPDPTPNMGPTRLQKMETNLVREPVREPPPNPHGGTRKGNSRFGVSDSVLRKLEGMSREV